MSWRDAQDYCRNIDMDLVSIRSLEENRFVLNATQTQAVWIGLFKDPWTWSDGSSSSFRFWRRSQPNNDNDQACVLAVFLDEGRWNDRRCNLNQDFICQGGESILFNINIYLSVTFVDLSRVLTAIGLWVF